MKLDLKIIGGILLAIVVWFGIVTLAYGEDTEKLVPIPPTAEIHPLCAAMVYIMTDDIMDTRIVYHISAASKTLSPEQIINQQGFAEGLVRGSSDKEEFIKKVATRMYDLRCVSQST